MCILSRALPRDGNYPLVSEPFLFLFYFFSIQCSPFVFLCHVGQQAGEQTGHRTQDTGLRTHCPLYTTTLQNSNKALSTLGN